MAILEIPDELMAANVDASESLLSREEVRVLFQGERRNNPSGERVVWPDEARLAQKQRYEEVL
jgi:hypothetical protein